MLDKTGLAVDPKIFTPTSRSHSSSAPRPIREVERIFVHPAIKKALCQTKDTDRKWLGKVRPWLGITITSTCASNARRVSAAACRNRRRPATTVAERKSINGWRK